MAQVKFGTYGQWKRVKNLGWLLRNATWFNTHLIVWVEKDPAADGCEGELSVHFDHYHRGRGTFTTSFADFSVFKAWLKRKRRLHHTFRFLGRGMKTSYEMKV